MIFLFPKLTIEGLLGRMPGGSLYLSIFILFTVLTAAAEEFSCPEGASQKKIFDPKLKSTTLACFVGNPTQAKLHGPHQVSNKDGRILEKSYFLDGKKVSKKDYENSNVAASVPFNQKKEIQRQNLWENIALTVGEKTEYKVDLELMIDHWSFNSEEYDIMTVDFKDPSKISLQAIKTGLVTLVGYGNDGSIRKQLAIKISEKAKKRKKLSDTPEGMTLEQFKQLKTIPFFKEVMIKVSFQLDSQTTLESNYNCSIRLMLEENMIVLTGLKYGENKLLLYGPEKKLIETISFSIK